MYMYLNKIYLFVSSCMISAPKKDTTGKNSVKYSSSQLLQSAALFSNNSISQAPVKYIHEQNT